jgi:imidazolonepropionase-like amidohydrolase
MTHLLAARRPCGVAALLLAALAGCGAPTVITEGVVIRNVTVIDGTDREPRPNMSFVVSGERILAVRPNAEVEVAGSVAEIDGAGKFLIPGLWDMHVHMVGYAERSFPLFLANGVTTVRDVGGELQQSGWLRQETRFKRLLGPRVLISGPMLESELTVQAARGTLAEGSSIATPDSATAVAVVDSLALAGVDHIKVHGGTPRAAYFAAAGAAARHGLPLVGHVPDSVMPDEAIAAGQRTIEHGSKQAFANSARGADLSQWMLAEMQRYLDSRDGQLRPLGIFRYRIIADDSASQAYDLPTARRFAELAAARDVWFDPTLVVWRAFVLRNEPGVWRRPEHVYVPRVVREYQELPPPDAGATPADRERGREQWQAAHAAFAELVSAGAKFVAGTDVPVFPMVPGFSLHDELQLLHEIGLSPLQALQAATRNAAAAAGMLGEVGTIEEGKIADLVLLDGDPLADLGNTTRIVAVITRGRLLDRATLDRFLEDAKAFARQP